MKHALLALSALLLSLSPARADDNGIGQACRGERSCFSALDGVERGLCQAYKENSSCFSALDDENRGWCEVMKEGKSCFMALDGAARAACEAGRRPGEHLFWQGCANGRRH